MVDIKPVEIDGDGIKGRQTLKSSGRSTPTANLVILYT